jgi:hypothetical protein
MHLHCLEDINRTKVDYNCTKKFSYRDIPHR